MTEAGPRIDLSPDRPITSRKEDLLGRSDFAKSVASTIRSWRGKDSLVIALYGPWGSGKSSVKNMVVECLRESQEDGPLIVEFNPWQWAGQDQLTEAFFREIGSRIGKCDSSSQHKKIAAKISAYGAYIKAGSSFLQVIPKLVVSLLLVVSAIGLGSSFTDLAWVHAGWRWLCLLVFLFAGFMKWGGELAERVALAIEARSAAKEQSLSEVKNELAGLLRGLEKSVLVVADDVDRLSAAEIRLLFQLIKANADFPNLIYLLLFQRNIVEESLQETAPTSGTHSGRHFLEKIVQVGFDIPMVERTRLERILLKGLGDLIKEEKIAARFSEGRWERIFVNALRPYFRTVRDVSRFLNSLQFHIGLYGGGDTFEVNPVDLIVLEALRVFEPEVYHRLPEVKTALTLSHEGTGKDTAKRLIETVIGQAVEENREVIREVLTELFPLTRRILGRFESWRDPDGWLRDLRACHPDVFDRYFLLTIPGGDIAQADLDRVLSLAGDKENLGTELRAFRQRNLLAVLLDRIRAHKGQIEASHRSSLVATLFDVGDDLLLDEPEYAFSIGADSRAYQIIESFLVDEKNPKMRGIILKRATEASTGLYLPVMVTSFAEETREENPEFMDPDDLAEVKKECVRRIRIAATSGQLRTHPRLNIFLLRWRDWSGPDEPGEWTAKLIESDDGLPAFLRSFLSKVFYEEAGGVSGVRWEMKIESMESLIPVEKLEEGVRKLDPQRLDEESRRAVTAFQIAMKRRQAGKRSEEWANDLDW